MITILLSIALLLWVFTMTFLYRTTAAALIAERVLSHKQALALEDLQETARSLTKKLEASLAVNGAFQESRDTAWDLYQRSAIGAGNAQAWLLRELQKNMMELNQLRAQLGKPPAEVPTELSDFVADFRQTHIEDARVKNQAFRKEHP